ncbi:hypothetical protein [Pelagibacterium sediminicola]|uniref:hypothetical protein n=1 Tax=Pelagibacterium sediminicola TaxID=2248761 RepID=UPI001300719D|nr:hypothetical protein [Pelagibacterium sediminicola]
MTALLIDQVRNVDPALLKGKGPTERVRIRRQIKTLALLTQQQQAKGYRARVQKGKT